MAAAPSSGQRVLLGFKDAKIGDESSSWDVSKIGGLPDPPPHVTLLFPTCPLCSAVLCHVVQVYCPLEGSQYHRVIHVFACSNPSCWGKPESWAALRSQSLEGHRAQSAPVSSRQEIQMAAADWGVDADDWGCDGEDPVTTPAVSHVTSLPPALPQTDCAAQLQSLSLADGPEPGQTGEAAFQSYYMAVADEADCEGDEDLDHARRLLREYEQREESIMEDLGGSEGKGEERYEKCDLHSRSLTFYKFLKRISACRHQILRYSWNGSPLYISPPDTGFQPSPCARCRGKRVFEFQLMPALVTMLRGTKADVMLEFGTVLIFTCERSCWDAGSNTPVQEVCLIQDDPDQKYFK